jgi:hypothetical protein
MKKPTLKYDPGIRRPQEETECGQTSVTLATLEIYEET